MELGQKLKEARRHTGLKQEELAQQIGVSRQTVSNWENNRSYPDIASVMKLSDLYGLSLDELLKEDRNVQAHFENKAIQKKRFWQLALEYAQYLLEPEKAGSYVLDVETRYDGIQEYALYRIPYKCGEFRFILTFDMGTKDALYTMWER